ncbi:MAG TPA: 50S ribosomal protein L31 [Polyangia bacterium]
MPKNGIHPLYKASTITCACGNAVETYTTRGSFNVDICSQCHPFYTGKQKFLDTAGRIEKFNKKYKVAGKAAPAEGSGNPGNAEG